MNQRHAERDLGDGSRRDTVTRRQYRHTYTHIVIHSLIFSVLQSRSPILLFLFPSLSACLASKQAHQLAKYSATPQRLSVTFSALGSISNVIISCLCYCGSTTKGAVSLQTNCCWCLLRAGLDFCRAKNGPLSLWDVSTGHLIQSTAIVIKGWWEACVGIESRLDFISKIMPGLILRATHNGVKTRSTASR